MPSGHDDDDDRSSSESNAPERATGGTLPLSRNASRALVIGSVLFVIAATLGGTWLILSLARSGPPPQEAVSPADTTDTSSMSNGE